MAGVGQKRNDSRPSFHSIGDDIDALVDDVARRRGIPSLKVPDNPAAPVAPVSLPALQPIAAPSAMAAEDSSTGRHVKVWCPDYLLDELFLKARERRVTLNFLVVEALSKSGYRVEPADLIPDGRRLRGKGSSQ